ncbi:nuclease domain-containing protein [Thiothrix subterranea]|uniref:nuclease domain-containing protein n=1 Tax=Thiothrix subterranea TaxID=2735563 RepID=UPI00280AC86B|nr:nuclease domain-containing protein [Thiothrix subterranea]
MKQLEEMIKKDKDNLLQSLKGQDQDDDLLTIKNKIDEIKQFPIKIKEALTSQPKINNDMVKIQTLTIRLERKQNDYLGKVQFKASVSYMNDEIFTSESNSIIIISFAKILFDGVFEEGDSYTISGVVNESKYPTRYKNIIHNIEFVNILDIKKSNIVEYEYRVITVRLKKNKFESYGKHIVFNGNVMTDDGLWFQHKENDFYSFKFHKDIFPNAFRENITYQITCYISRNIRKWSKNNREGYIHEIIFEYIEDIKIIESVLEKKLIKEKETFLRLESLGWQMDMSPQELVKQNHEKDTIDKSLDDLTKQNTEITKHKKELLKKITLIKKLIDRFKALKIKEDCSFPNSMTFIQNPNYQGSKKVFTSFLETIGIEEDMFKSLLLVDQIGLIDLPALYEKWCLLQIIKVLIEEYHFIPDQNWKKTLVSQVLTIKYNVKMNFFNDVIARDVILGYEEELKSKKRPDFVLMVKSKRTETTKKFIMDAKFRENVDIRGLMQELYHDKNYSEDRKNKVFILHPDVNNKIDNFSNPQSWADQSYYGETQLMNYDWDKDDPECEYVEVLPNHRYGAILLSPFDRSAISEGGYLDNLKRLIAMFLQYGMEDNKKLASNDGKIDSMTKENPFCTLCGSSNLYIKRFTPRSGVGYGYEVTCKDCTHHMEYNYCSGCKNRIIKNGRYWSYHATKPIDQFNIKCPHCGDFLLEESR